MFLFFILLLTSVTYVDASAPESVRPSRFTVIHNFTRRGSTSSNDSAPDTAKDPLLPRKTKKPLAEEKPNDSSSSAFESHEINSEIIIEPAVTEFMNLREKAKCYEGRNLDKNDLTALSNDFLRKILQISDLRIAIATLQGACSIFKRIIFEEEHSDIDYIAKKLKDLKTLDPVERAAVIKAELSFDLTTLKEIQRTHMIVVFNPLAAPSKTCLRKSIDRDIETKTTPKTDEPRRKSISFQSDLSSPTKKKPDETQGFLSRLLNAE